MPKILLIILSIGLLATGCAPPPETASLKSQEVCFENTCVQVKIADTEETHAQGLMFVKNLPADEGMLFIFDRETLHAFWMKNTLIPLDMIWINQNLKIVHIEQAVPCEKDPCPSYQPAQPALYVLEVNTGFTNQYGIEIGDTVTINN